jgi:hypothetical protein
MTETPGVYNVGDRPLRPQPPPSFEVQLKALPPAVRSVAESLALRDMESEICTRLVYKFGGAIAFLIAAVCGNRP